MPDNQSSRTSVTLLGRLRHDPKDQAAWNEFVARYEPKIFQWCSRLATARIRRPRRDPGRALEAPGFTGEVRLRSVEELSRMAQNAHASRVA